GLKLLSTKGYTGHTLGAAGGLEAVFTALGLRQGWIPASAGFLHQDDAIPVAPVTEKTAVAGCYAVSTSLAFGGNNAALVIGRGGC
ncbi:MAG: beta-ketoacyl-[acyl-carrier-protein] synthase family protein, partial [Deltaproteobacteria bacterium]|nr:beta-ketoacyl-[acyl-carrier-protein] synthase family protein [Deltaproteobacteria bacterium]